MKKLISIILSTILFSNLVFNGAIFATNSNPFQYYDEVFRGRISASFLKQEPVQKKFIVQFFETVSLREVFQAVKNFGFKPLGLSEDRMFEVWGVEENDFKAAYAPIIKYTSKVDKRALLRTPNDTRLSEQWALSTMNLKSAWDVTVGSKSVKIAVLDTGIDRSTKDLNTTNILDGYDFNTHSAVTNDLNGHGTGVASVLAAAANNNSGMAGVCWRVSIVPYKIYEPDGTTDTGREIEALKMALLDGCKIVSLSFGGPTKNDAEEATINSLVEKGVLVFAAAGNDGKYMYNFPASYSSVFSVSAIDKYGAKWSGSNYNPSVDITAPGKEVTIIIKNGSKFEIGLGSGTSFATPYAAGTVALACALAPDINFKTLYNALPSVCKDRGEVGKDRYFGYGTIDARKLVDYANANWILKEPVESTAPKKFTVNNSSKPNPGTMVFDPPATGTYFFDSLGTKDTDLDIYKAIIEGDSYHFDDVFAGDSLKLPSEVLTPFDVQTRLSSSSKYLLDAYANDKCIGDSINFLMFSPFEMLGRSVSFSSSNLSDCWGQELIFKAKYSGQKRAVLSSKVVGAAGGFSVYKNNVLVGSSSILNNEYIFDFSASAGDEFSIVVNSESNALWTLKINELNNMNSNLREFNVEGAKITPAFSPSVYEYDIEATNQRISMYWLPYFSSVSSKVSNKDTRALNYFVAGGVEKDVIIVVNDGNGNENEYEFHLNAEVSVVGTATPKPTVTPSPTPTPKPTMTPKPLITKLKIIKKGSKIYLSISVSWNKKAALKLYVLNGSGKLVRSLWAAKSTKAGKKTILWDLKDSKKKMQRSKKIQFSRLERPYLL